MNRVTLNVAITGAAGMIGYSLIPMVIKSNNSIFKKINFIII